MYKSTKILLFLSFLALLLILICFPICFDNNDDQIMFMMSAGVLSNMPTAEIIHINFSIGYLIKSLFELFPSFNWYTLTLELIQIFALLGIFYVFINNNRNSIYYKIAIVFFLFCGFSVLCVVKIQFTVVSLTCAIGALLLLQSEVADNRKYYLTFLFILLSYLVRKDGCYIFSAFYVPIIIIKLINKQTIKKDILFFVVSILLFNLLIYINNQTNREMHKQQVALDILADRPVNFDTATIHKYGFTADDLLMMYYRYPATQQYDNGTAVVNLATALKRNRNLNEVIGLLKIFVNDEQYILTLYILSIVLVFLFVKQKRLFAVLNLFFCATLIMYLAFTARIPHRVTFPILLYVFLANLYFLLYSTISKSIKNIILLFFVLIGFYKLYCTFKMYPLQKEYHQTFTTYKNIIDHNPDKLFINGIDGIELPYLDAWQRPDILFPEKNILFAGWNMHTKDFKQVLKFHHLKNLTTDLKDKDNIYFITNSTEFQQAFIVVMKHRYGIKCHFEVVSFGKNELPTKKLIFDN